jgi:hypothetical protein
MAGVTNGAGDKTAGDGNHDDGPPPDGPEWQAEPT